MGEMFSPTSELPPDPGPEHVALQIASDELLIVGLTPEGMNYATPLFVHRKRNADIKRLTAHPRAS
jgi:hypothetical protein